MKKTVIIPQSSLDWLLEDNNPPVRNLTKEFLLNQTLTDREKEEINSYPPIKTILSKIKANGSWGFPKNPYKKYVGDYWQFIFLRELRANLTPQITKEMCPYIISLQLPSGGFTHKIGSKIYLICLTSNLIHSFLYFDFSHEGVMKGLKLITDHVLENQGVLCDPNPTYNLLPDCQMALTKVLGMYSQIPKDKYTSEIKEVIKIIEEKLIENKIFKYIPYGAREFHKKIKQKKIAEIRKIRNQMIKDPAIMTKGTIKKSWQQFSFPQSYTSDALETLFYVSKLGLNYREEYFDALELIINKMTKEGKWINENNFRSPMSVEIEPKKALSKWITFRACCVLNYFLDLKFR